MTPPLAGNSTSVCCRNGNFPPFGRSCKQCSVKVGTSPGRACGMRALCPQHAGAGVFPRPASPRPTRPDIARHGPRCPGSGPVLARPAPARLGPAWPVPARICLILPCLPACLTLPFSAISVRLWPVRARHAAHPHPVRGPAASSYGFMSSFFVCPPDTETRCISPTPCGFLSAVSQVNPVTMKNCPSAISLKTKVPLSVHTVCGWSAR